MGRAPRERPRFSEEWLVAVLDALSEGVIALAMDGRILAANPAAEDLLGFSISQRRYERWDGLSWSALVDEDRSTLDPGDHPVAATLRDGRPRAARIVGLEREGDVRWLALATHVLPAQEEGATGGVVVSFQDHTTRVAAEHEQHRLVAVLREFMMTATHDLRSPLMAILGHGELLTGHGDEMSAAERDRSIRSIVRQATALSRLVQDLGVAARLEARGVSADPDDVDVAELVELALDGVAELDAFIIEVPEGLMVRVDRDHGRRMLVNLVDNATKYGRPPYEVSAEDAHERIEIAVSDRGPGVPDGFVPRLFERFTRAGTDGPSGGTGLGLAIVAGLAQVNGGDVRYEPNVPEGARFVLELPRA